MEFRSGTEVYYRQMLELTDKLRKSEEERLKLEGKFNEIMQQSRDEEYERLRIMRHKYHKFLEEDKARQERNENILRTLDRIESRAKQLAAKTDRFKAFRKQYFENYLKQIPKQKKQTFDISTQPPNRPQYQNESVRRKLFANEPTTTVNENVETKLALLEKYLRDNFDNFPRDFPTSTTKQNGLYDRKQTNVLYDNKNYLDDASDSKESQEIEAERYSPRKMNGHYQKASELLGNRIEQELDRLRNKKENELNNNSLDAQEINAEQVINDYKKLVSKSEEKFGLRNDLQNGPSKKAEIFDSINKIAQIDEANKLHMDIPYNVDEKEESSLKLDLLEEDENSEDTKPPTDISLNLSTPSQLKDQFDDSKQNKLREINNEEFLENSSKSEEITSIEKQKVQPLHIQRKGSNIIETKPILNQFDEIIKTPEISNNGEKIEQNVVYSQENINTKEQYIEKPQLNEFGESISNQQYSKGQKYHPETYLEENQNIQKQEYIKQQYVAPRDKIQEQSNYKQDNKNITPQDDQGEIYNEQQYGNPDQQYESPEQQYENPEQQFQNTELHENSAYKNPEQQFEASENQYPQSEQQYISPDQQYESPEQQYEVPEQQYDNPEQYEAPEQQYEAPEQQYEAPKQQYQAPEQQYQAPEQQYQAPEQQYQAPEKQYQAPEQQYQTPEQQYEAPEQQYEAPEQYTNPEQQEYPPENYDQQYPQQNYPEGEYDPQNYSQAYETQQPENYDTQNYPQQQYPEGYDPRQFTEEQQLEYDQQYPQAENYPDQQYPQAESYPDQQYPQADPDQQYPQAESYPDQQYPQADQQFVENTGEYDPQGQYPENLYQTGQEYLQGEQNVDLQYETEQQQQDYPDGYVGQEIEKNVPVNETANISEGNESATVSQQEQLEDNKPLVEKKLPNLADMLDTDTSESVKPDSKVSDSDFDFSNTKT